MFQIPQSSPQSRLIMAVLFVVSCLVVGVLALQLAAHYFWWGLSLLIIAFLVITVGVYRFFSHQVQQLRQQVQQTEQHLHNTTHLHRLLLHHVDQGVFGVAADGQIIFTNPRAEEIIGFTHADMVGKKMHPLIHHHHRDGKDYLEEECPLYLTLADGVTRFVTEELFWCADGTPIDVDYVVAALRDGDNIIGGLVLFRDTTFARKQQTLLIQRERSLAQAQELAQLGSWRFDVQERRLEYSDECYRLLEWPKDKPITFGSLLRIIDPEDLPLVVHRWRTLLQENVSDIQYRIHVGDDIKWLRERTEVQRTDDGKLYCIGAVLDITEIKYKEAQLRRSKQRLRELVAHREEVREAERAHIAREVHDELGQQLTALRMDATMLKLHYAALAPELEVHIQRMKEAIDSCIVSVRQVASSLRPAVLDMGVIASVDWLLKNFNGRTGIATVLNAPAGDLLLDDARATAVFRVLQESLTNIVRHAQASQVEVNLCCEEKYLHITVEDNGRGFDSKVVRNKRKNYDTPVNRR